MGGLASYRLAILAVATRAKPINRRVVARELYSFHRERVFSSFDGEEKRATENQKSITHPRRKGQRTRQRKRKTAKEERRGVCFERDGKREGKREAKEKESRHGGRREGEGKREAKEKESCHGGRREGEGK